MKRIPIAFTVLALASACASAQAPPPAYVRAAEASRSEPPSPAAAPAEWLLAFIDVETTGLVPGWHEMIDIGIAIADVDGRVLDTLFLRIQPAHPERLSPGARAVNAFDAARWKTLGALTPAAAVDSIVAFHRRVAGSRPTLMVAFNSQFDAAFLDHLFRARNRSWREMYHYFVLDLPSMAWSLGLRDLRGGLLAERLGVPDEPHVAEEHTGITGAMVNVRIYQALMRLRATRPSRFE
jgi:DNA polymerase III alpha subunit (gram-positive type)